MGHLLRLVSVGGMAGLAVLSFSFGLIHDAAPLVSPLQLTLFFVIVVLYLVPTAVAIYRDCASSAWIAALNVLFGWTLFGWVLALGWAARGKRTVRMPEHHLVSH